MEGGLKWGGTGFGTGTGKALESYSIILLRVIKLDASEVESKRSDRAERRGQDVTVADLCTVPKCSGLTARRLPPLPSRRFLRACHLAPRLQHNEGFHVNNSIL